MRRPTRAHCDGPSPFPLSLQRPSLVSRLSSDVSSRIPHPLPVPSLGEVRSAGVPRRRRERGERGSARAPALSPMTGVRGLAAFRPSSSERPRRER